MPNENRISLDIAPADLQAIENAIEVLQTKLVPYLLTINTEERQSLPKMGDKTVAFVEKSYEHAVQNPQLVPQYLDVPELKKDIDAVKVLRNIANPLEQIAISLDDTIMIAGSEAYTASLAFYNSVKGAGKVKVAGAEQIYNDLSPRFPSKSSVKTQTQASKA